MIIVGQATNNGDFFSVSSVAISFQKTNLRNKDFSLFLNKKRKPRFKGSIRVLLANIIPAFVEKQIDGVSLSTNQDNYVRTYQHS
jgi:hypothetical protein